ncbi:MAG: sensor histidine kinase [Thermodesulfobacteriota bacterium]
MPIAYMISKTLSQPIYELIDRIIRIASKYISRTIDSQHMNKFVMLSKILDEMEFHLQKRFEEILKERDYLQVILEGMIEGVLLVDERGRIQIINEALRKFLALPSLYMRDRMTLEVIRNAELEEAIKRVIQSGQREVLEINLPSFGGKTFEVNVVGVPNLREESGTKKIKGVLAVFHDITRLKELEKIRKDFVANVSHELRTPLTTIKGYAETLLDGALKEEVAFQFVEVIKKHSDRLEKIVKDLLILSKIESQEFQWEKEPILISDLIYMALELMGDSFKKRNINIKINPISADLRVKGDFKYLEQALFNILDNAVKYGREGGTIIISAKKKDQREVEISVADDGIGIPREDLPRIFERFYRVEKGRSRELGGTGLGLSIVKHIIHAHGGRVWAESTIGKGSTFFFTLPL